MKKLTINLLKEEDKLMLDKIEDFLNSLKDKQICFIGIGISHKELIDLFLEYGAKITVCDKASLDKLGDTAIVLKNKGVDLKLGEKYLDDVDNSKFDIIMRTPGLNFNHPKLVQARKKGIVVTSEMELFFELCPCKIIGITGSDGKTTTTTIVGKLLLSQGFTVHLGGNIGKPLLYRIKNIKPLDYAVVELSSFQLMSMRKSPDTALITNISPNHLDMHFSMQEYIEAKMQVVLHQNAFSRAVLNEDNELSINASKDVRGELLTFSHNKIVENGVYLDENKNIQLSYHGKVENIMNMDKIRLHGMHNVDDYMAAICITAGIVSRDNIIKVAESFNGVEHRFEYVREINGVKWYNDAIASSPTRTIAGLNTMDDKIILIAGGYDKKIPFDTLAPKIVEKVKYLILMGDTAPKIKQAVINTDGFVKSNLTIVDVDNMENAVKLAFDFAQKGDIVALSPACASFDKYDNFEQRGNHFKRIVNDL